MFKVYSNTTEKYLVYFEFKDLIIQVFSIKKPNKATKEENSDRIKSLFNIFGSDITRRMSLRAFLHMVQTGKKIHPFYLKFKKRFGPYLAHYRKVLCEEL